MATTKKTAAPMMRQLGAFQFSLTTAAYQSLAHSQSWNWAKLNRFGQAPVSQFVGMGGETITLPGVIYPNFRGGFGQIDAMRAEAEKQTPLIMVDGDGNVYGKWTITEITETQRVFGAGGKPLKIEFNLNLQKFEQ
jgi:phage protein U